MESSDAVKKNLEAPLRFHHKEAESFKELSKFLDNHDMEFARMLDGLKAKKDKLWMSKEKLKGDYTTWQLRPDD